MFKLWLESSLGDLYDSAVAAFPKTKARQHLVHTIQIDEFHYIPYLGVRTLFVRARATNEDRQYKTVMLFRGVNYQKEHREGLVEVRVGGTPHYLRPLSVNNSQVLVRCSCSDHRWRFAWYNSLPEYRALYGKVPPRYESKGIGPPANPLRRGGECKHLMKMAQELRGMGLIV